MGTLGPEEVDVVMQRNEAILNHGCELCGTKCSIEHGVEGLRELRKLTGMCQECTLSMFRYSAEGALPREQHEDAVNTTPSPTEIRQWIVYTCCICKAHRAKYQFHAWSGNMAVMGTAVCRQCLQPGDDFWAASASWDAEALAEAAAVVVAETQAVAMDENMVYEDITLEAPWRMVRVGRSRGREDTQGGAGASLQRATPPEQQFWCRKAYEFLAQEDNMNVKWARDFEVTTPECYAGKEGEGRGQGLADPTVGWK